MSSLHPTPLTRSAGTAHWWETSRGAVLSVLLNPRPGKRVQGRGAEGAEPPFHLTASLTGAKEGALRGR